MGKEKPQYITLMNLGKIKGDTEDEENVIKQVGLTGDVKKLIREYFERRAIREAEKQEKLENAFSESGEALKRAKKALDSD